MATALSWLGGLHLLQGRYVEAEPVLKLVRERLPEHEILVTTITSGGYETAASWRGKLISDVFFAPFDLPWAVRHSGPYGRRPPCDSISRSIVATFIRAREVW